MTPLIEIALNVATSFLFLVVGLSWLQVDSLTPSWPINIPSSLCDLFLRNYSVDFLRLIRQNVQVKYDGSIFSFRSAYEEQHGFLSPVSATVGGMMIGPDPALNPSGICLVETIR